MIETFLSLPLYFMYTYKSAYVLAALEVINLKWTSATPYTTYCALVQSQNGSNFYVFLEPN